MSILNFIVAQIDLEKVPLTLNNEKIIKVIENGKKIDSTNIADVNLIAKNDKELVSAVWLKNLQSLQDFATSPEHLNFMFSDMNKMITGIWTSQINIDSIYEAKAFTHAFIFGIKNLTGFFEWEIHAYIQAMKELPGDIFSGNSLEQRDIFRAGGIVLLNADQKKIFEKQLSILNKKYQNIVSITNISFVEIIHLKN
ncbi:MAG: hypothetical protein P8J51_00905 [Dehalococcoidia bacterium]|nr:hypothetical protein [Dehalococcoidia bacterium]